MITMNVSGNVTADATTKNINGTDVTSFTIASNRRYTTATGEVKEETIFMPCVLWNKKDAAVMFYKGRPVNIAGYFNVRNYVAADGAMKTYYSVRVSSFQVFGKKQIENEPASEPQQEFNNNYPETEKPPMQDVIDDLPF